MCGPQQPCLNIVSWHYVSLSGPSVQAPTTVTTFIQVAKVNDFLKGQQYSEWQGGQLLPVPLTAVGPRLRVRSLRHDGTSVRVRCARTCRELSCLFVIKWKA